MVSDGAHLRVHLRGAAFPGRGRGAKAERALTLDTLRARTDCSAAASSVQAEPARAQGLTKRPLELCNRPTWIATMQAQDCLAGKHLLTVRSKLRTTTSVTGRAAAAGRT